MLSPAAAMKQLRAVYSTGTNPYPLKSAHIRFLHNSNHKLNNSERTDPKVAAEALINKFPGETLAAKSGNVLLYSSIAAYIISKEVYVIDLEFFEAICLIGAFTVWYSAGKESAIAYINDRKQAIKSVLTQAREDHKAVVKERMEHIGKLSDVVDVTKSLYGLSKEVAKLEAEAFALKQQVAYTSEVKSVLDQWVRHEANVREREQKLLAESVIEKIKASLADPKMQQNILTQTLADVEKIASKPRA
ncbi:atp4 subunit B of the stator stalk of mitochondrial F1F0 ATP synthase [Nowakowskiella sp. JEL0407]|nr:atp4 subunit B of the stator stalk of mitochondrial F1F0 ATP synthase [Nowakowskiella sp. JEL0407]